MDVVGVVVVLIRDEMDGGTRQAFERCRYSVGTSRVQSQGRAGQSRAGSSGIDGMGRDRQGRRPWCSRGDDTTGQGRAGQSRRAKQDWRNRTGSWMDEGSERWGGDTA